MALKYETFDQQLLTWLSKNQVDVTTSQVAQALGITDGTVLRHLSRRFTQLEDKGILVCRLNGTTRVCNVVRALPATLAKKQWRTPPQDVIPAGQPIPAENSAEFEAAGGKIHRLPSHWDKRPTCNAVGLISIDHILAALD